MTTLFIIESGGKVKTIESILIEAKNLFDKLPPPNSVTFTFGGKS